jgi:hypothetical protein
MLNLWLDRGNAFPPAPHPSPRPEPHPMNVEPSLPLPRRAPSGSALRSRQQPVLDRLPVVVPTGALGRTFVALEPVRREFPGVLVEVRDARRPADVAVRVADWLAPASDPAELDRAVRSRHGRTALEVDAGSCGPAETACAALGMLTRVQRLVDRRNSASGTREFADVEEAHRRMHDLSRPLVMADWEHARDVRHWVLRLDPDAGFAVQAAALFHDVERLVGEADRRIEHLASDYGVFKTAHARGSGAIARRVLARLGLPGQDLERIEALIAAHEDGGDDPEAALLADADGLSFFSLNSGGFLDYYGREHTSFKLRWTLERMSAGARRRLRSVRLRSDVAELLRGCRRR